MTFRQFLQPMSSLRSAALLGTVLLLAPAGPVSAGPLDFLRGEPQARQAEVVPVQAQLGDQRVTELQEQVRRLNGIVEDMNFQILQLQEEVRKQLEDMQIRIDQLEGGGASGSTNGGAPAAGQSGALDEPANGSSAGVDQAAATPTPQQEAQAALSDEIPMDAVDESGAVDYGAPPSQLGSLTLDGQGAIESASTAPGTDATTVASVASASDPSSLYAEGYDSVLAGDYVGAEQRFRQFVAAYPNDQHAADARFWLGESLRGQERYADAVEVFLDGTKDYPDSRKAPEMMLKLGVSLAAMGQQEVACQTLGAIGERYPSTSEAFQSRLSQEISAASC